MGQFNTMRLISWEELFLRSTLKKVYDHADWNFLDRVLWQKDHGSKWRSVSSLRWSMVSIGVEGLRQGDPLSISHTFVFCWLVFTGSIEVQLRVLGWIVSVSSFCILSSFLIESDFLKKGLILGEVIRQH